MENNAPMCDRVHIKLIYINYCNIRVGAEHFSIKPGCATYEQGVAHQQCKMLFAHGIQYEQDKYIE